MIYCDSHTHSAFSFDAEIPVEQMVLSAIDKGVRVLTITDHCDALAIGVPDNEFGVILEEAVPASVREIRRVAELYRDRIKVLAGVELGEPTHCPDKTHTALTMAEYDLILASTHEVKGREDFYFLTFTDETTPVLLREYFLEQLEVVQWNGFDSLAHFDYPVRYVVNQTGKLPDLAQFKSITDEILKTLADNRKALEVNTSTVSSALGRTMPGLDILRRFRELGGKYITLGSDAHKAERISQNFDTAIELIKTAGFDAYCYYEKHCPVEVKI